jgi:CRISPR/Cas system-associated exonuclease Cas4 (RecB family)
VIFFGLLVHQTIEEIHRLVLDGQLPMLTKERLRELFDRTFKFLTLADVRPIGKTAREAAFRQVVNYFDQNQEELKRVVETEVDVSVEKEGYILTGKVDLLMGGDGRLELLDFKTSPRPLDSPELIRRYEQQLCTYAHILERRHGKRVDRLFLYWTSEKAKANAIMEFPYRPEMVDEAGKRFDEVVGKIKAKEFKIIQPPEAGICKECDLRTLCLTDGTIGPNINHLVRCIIDEVLGIDRHLNEIIWRRAFAHSDSRRCGIIHDAILLYSKSDSWTWNEVRQAPDPEYVETFFDCFDEKVGKKYQRITLTAPGITKEGPSGKPWRGVDPSAIGRHWAKSHEELDRLDHEGRIHWPKKGVPRLKRYEDEYEGMVIQDIWTDLNKIHNQSAEATGYNTQKPTGLLDRIIRASSREGDLVADFFCGSGTALVVAETLGRRWIGCDLGKWGVHVSRKRLLAMQGCRPFEVLNLGRYERQYWQGITFASDHDKTVTEQTLYEYLAFILQLYGAQPVPGLSHLHGKKGRAMIHIGSVDAPVTIDEISHAIDECVRLKQPELHVLGWEWEMGLAGPNNEYRKGGLMQDESKKKGVKLLLLQIPREVMEQQAVDKGDIDFFELAYLDVEIKQKKKLTAEVKLNDFVIPNTELIPDDVRMKIKKWSDYIDYWAIDWDFQNDTFMQGWVAYRTRQERSLPLACDPHTYDKPGKYRVLIKVIDIFGNDTSQAHTVEVK